LKKIKEPQKFSKASEARGSFSTAKMSIEGCLKGQALTSDSAKF
jgi:hypothetical protein